MAKKNKPEVIKEAAVVEKHQRTTTTANKKTKTNKKRVTVKRKVKKLTLRKRITNVISITSSYAKNSIRAMRTNIATVLRAVANIIDK